MTQSSRLAAFRAGADAAPVPEEPENPAPGEELDEGGCPKKPQPKESPMTQEEIDAAVAKAATEATAAANQRFATVLASEHYAGREQLAQTLLGNDKMTAEEITAALAAAPKAEAPPAPAALTEEQQREAAEQAGRDAMKEALAETRNSSVAAAGGGGKPDPRAEADAVWTRAYGLN